MKKLILFLLLIPIVYAGLPINDLAKDIESIRLKANNFSDIGDDSVIVQGLYASPLEKMSFRYLSGNYEKMTKMKKISEQDYTPVKDTILIGGPTQNSISAKLLNDPSFTVEKNDLKLGSVYFLESVNNSAIIFSDYAGYKNLPKRIFKSPLSKIVPPEYIPTVATIIGFSLLWLFNLIYKLLFKTLRYKFSSRIMKIVKKKELKEKFVGIKIKGIRFKLREWIAILVSATVWAASLSYLYLAPNTDIILFLLMTIGANYIVYGLRHLVRLVMDKHHQLHTEYIIWIWGAIVTALTCWMGNTFAMAGYIISDKYSKIEGRIGYFTNLITFIAFMVLFIWNILNPSIFIQMLMLLSLGITFLQMLPFSPFAGKNIYRWNKKLWWFSFVPITISYIMVNLIV